jgi:hypothetical protein
MGIPITIGGVAGIGLFDEQGQVIVQDGERGEVIVLVPTLRVQTSAWPNVEVDQAVVIGSKNFTIRKRLPEGDGGLTVLQLGSGPVPAPGGSGPQNVIDGGSF